MSLTEDQISEGIWVRHKHFKSVNKMLVVKPTGNRSWWGARYLADGNILVYGEYHLNELELDEPPKKSISDSIENKV